MFREDLDIMASKGKPMPLGLNLAEQLTYQALCHLYERYRTGTVSKAQARADKKEITDQYCLYQSKLDFLSRETQMLSEEIVEASEIYKRNRTIQNADKMFRAFWNGDGPRQTAQNAPRTNEDIKGE